MKILLTPQVNESKKILYIFQGETVIVMYDGESDRFDFSSFTDDGEVTEIATTLPMTPIISAKRENGILSMVLLNYISEDATDEEKFPVWKEV